MANVVSGNGFRGTVCPEVDPKTLEKGALLLGRKDSRTLFNAIAPVYGLFYDIQKRYFSRVVERVSEELNLASYHTVLDVGCGTGALCSVLNRKGLSVTGIDLAERMMDIARRQPENEKVTFIHANLTPHLGLPRNL